MAFSPLSSTSPLAPAPAAATSPLAPPPSDRPAGGRFAIPGDLLALQGHGSGARTPADVRADADRLFFPAVQDTGRAIHLERDARDVNAVDPPAVQEAARGQLLTNAGVEATLLRMLGPERTAAYERVAGMVEGDPLARLALQVLLAEGKLAGKKNRDGQDLLGTLERLTTAPLAAGVDRQALLRDLVQEIATPSAISQQYHGTCSVTAVQIKLAIEHPAEYARIVGGLASPAGQVQLAGGQTLSRLRGTERPGTITQVRPDGSKVSASDPRTVSARLWQPAMLQFSYGPAVRYDDATDRVVQGRAAPGAGSISKVIQAIDGEAPEVVNDWKLKGALKVDGRDDLIDRVARAATPERPVLLAVMYGEPRPFGHEVLVNRIAEGQVHFTNPWGMEERMAVAEFKQRIMGGYAHLGEF